MATTHLMTAEELLRTPQPTRCELVKGELRLMNPAGHRHGSIAAAIGARLYFFAKDKRLGKVYAAETGFVIERNPDTVRAPDAAFVSKARDEPLREHGFFEGPPDLAVEVLSPDDSASDTAQKVEMWLRCGCQAVWIVDPRRSTASISRLDAGRVTTVEVEVLRDESLLPGFELPAKELFEQG